MQQRNLVIHCQYDPCGPELTELILQSFRLFLQKELGLFADPSSE